MKTYRIRYYVGTLWSFVTQADYYDEEELQSTKPEEKFSEDLARTGFISPRLKVRIMPGCILTVKEVK
jgi:hypothetical protein